VARAVVGAIASTTPSSTNPSANSRRVHRPRPAGVGPLASSISLALTEWLDDQEDIRDARAVIAQEGNPSLPLAEVKRSLGSAS
jgi:hypothetical protein